VANVVYALFVETAEASDNALMTGAIAARAKELPGTVYRQGIDDWLASPVGLEAAAQDALLRYLRTAPA
jgi:hypothetical protein